MDIDLDVDFGDIDDFVLGLSNGAAYLNVYGVPPALHGDIDGSGFFDFGDIDDFIDLLSGGPLIGDLQSVPEPSALILAAIGLLGFVANGWRRRAA